MEIFLFVLNKKNENPQWLACQSLFCIASESGMHFLYVRKAGRLLNWAP